MRWLLMAVLVGLAGCSAAEPKYLDIARTARMGAEHEAVVIDGRQTTPQEWAGAAVTKLRGPGSGRFLWDDQGLYGLVEGGGWDVPGIWPYESLLLVIEVSSPPEVNGRGFTQAEVRFRVQGTLLTDPVAIVSVQRGYPFPTTAVDLQHLRVAGGRILVKRGFHWVTEYFIPWEAISGTAKPPPIAILHFERSLREAEGEFPAPSGGLK